MRIFDTHAHYANERFDGDREELIESRLPAAGVELICEVGCDLRDISATLALIEKYPHIIGAVGMHPHTAEHMTEAMAEELIRIAGNKKIAAIGEIGLDYYYDFSPREVQKLWFDRQLSIAEQVMLPVVLHIRDAMGDCMDILRAHRAGLIENGGVMHCYSGSTETAKECLDLGLMIGFGGSLTFKNNRRGVETAEIVPLDRFVFETDCPYLAPVPHRGERNDSSFISFVAEKFAEIRELSPDEAAETAFENGKRLYRL